MKRTARAALALFALTLGLLPSAAHAFLRTQTCYTPDIALPCPADPPHCSGNQVVRRGEGETVRPVADCDFFRSVPACVAPLPRCEGDTVVSSRNARSAGPVEDCVFVRAQCTEEETLDGCCTLAELACTVDETRADCPTGTVCSDGNCISPPGCDEGATCLAEVPRSWCDGETLVRYEERGTCGGGTCRPTERRDACPDGMLCRGGSCLPAGCSGPSGTNGCCAASDLTCDYPEEVTDCTAQGKTCVAGACVTPGGCTEGATCETAVLAPWCDGAQRVFYSTSATCASGVCRREELRADCPNGTVCRQGACAGAGLPGSLFACPEGESPKPVRWPTACVGYHLQLGPLRNRSALGRCDGNTFVLPDNGIRLERGWRSCEQGTVSFDCGQCTEADALPLACVPGGCADGVDCSASPCGAETLGSVCDGDAVVVLEQSGACEAGACVTVEQSRTDCAATGQWCVGGRCVSPAIDAPESNIAAAIEAGFSAWNGAPGSAWQAALLGETDETEIGIAVDDDGNPRGNVNLVVMQTETWNHSSIALGVTTPVFEADTGRIVTADMELNGLGGKRWMTGDTTDPDAYDLQNVVTHEAGHFLGLDHPPCFSDGSFTPACAYATMYASSGPGERQKRDLAADDLDAVAAAYPANTEPSCAPPSPGFFYARTLSQTAPTPSASDCPGADAYCGGSVATPSKPDDDCSTGGASGARWTTAATLLLLTLLRRRRGSDVR